MPYLLTDRAIDNPQYNYIVDYTLVRGDLEIRICQDSVAVHINARPSQLENYMLETWKLTDRSVTGLHSLVVTRYWTQEPTPEPQDSVTLNDRYYNAGDGLLPTGEHRDSMD